MGDKEKIILQPFAHIHVHDKLVLVNELTIYKKNLNLITKQQI